MSINANAYNITIRRAEIEDEILFEARIKEFPDVIEYADSSEDAYELAIDTIETAYEYFKEIGDAMPAPHVPSDDYSGRVTLRMPKSLHQSVSEAAAYESVSLNQYIVSALSYFSGFAHGQKTALDAPWRTVTITTKPTKTPTRRSHLTVISNNESGRYATG